MSASSNAKDLTNALLSAGMTPTGISEALAHRVSARTIYRWARGESVPQSKHDLDALIALRPPPLQEVVESETK